MPLYEVCFVYVLYWGVLGIHVAGLVPGGHRWCVPLWFSPFLFSLGWLMNAFAVGHHVLGL